MVTNCLNYTTNYYYSLNKRPLVFINHVCFSSLYGETRTLTRLPVNSGKIGVKVYFSKKVNEEMHDNYCLLNDRELSEYIEWIRKTVGFNLKINDKIKIDDMIGDLNYKIITVSFTKKYPYEIRLIAALIRNLYECPYNIMVKAAFLMSDLDEFKHLDFTERFSIAVNSLNDYNSNHSTFEYNGSDFYSNKSLRRRYLDTYKLENNVAGFMLKRGNIRFNRYNCKVVTDPNTEATIFDTLEEDYISNEFKKILIENYKIIKANE